MSDSLTPDDKEFWADAKTLTEEEAAVFDERNVPAMSVPMSLNGYEVQYLIKRDPEGIKEFWEQEEASFVSKHGIWISSEQVFLALDYLLPFVASIILTLLIFKRFTGWMRTVICFAAWIFCALSSIIAYLLIKHITHGYSYNTDNVDFYAFYYLLGSAALCLLGTVIGASISRQRKKDDISEENNNHFLFLLPVRLAKMVNIGAFLFVLFLIIDNSGNKIDSEGVLWTGLIFVYTIVNLWAVGRVSPKTDTGDMPKTYIGLWYRRKRMEEKKKIKALEKDLK